MVGRRERQNHAADTVQGGARGASRRELLLAGGASAPRAALAAAPAAGAFDRERHRGQTQEALNVAATIEVLTTIVTTTALQKLTLPQAAIDTVGAASREELDHHDVLTSEFGGRAATNKIWVPDAVFASPTALFTTLVVGEQICDRAFMKYSQRDQADGPGNGTTASPRHRARPRASKRPASASARWARRRARSTTFVPSVRTRPTQASSTRWSRADAKRPLHRRRALLDARGFSRS